STLSRARTGRVRTPHGEFLTPAFMPVGTRATVKGVLPTQLAQTGAEICLANTYHLLLRPGPERVRGMGGLHTFMNWPRPVLTDSGGYQAFSMADINTITDDGVTFKSIVDGATVHLSPERAIHVQNDLGADIIMAFDDCPPSDVDAASGGGVGGAGGEDVRAAADGAGGARNETLGGRADPRLVRAIKRDTKRAKGYDHQERLRIANERTVAWLDRCKLAHQRPRDQALFGIIQGGTDLERRSWSAERITNIELPGYAIGGVAVGEGFEEILSVVRHTAPRMPEGKPRYLMGVGYERDILAAVLSGVDMFDCVLPTRNGRNASAFTSTGSLRLRNAMHAGDPGPIEVGCDCPACGFGGVGLIEQLWRDGAGGGSGAGAGGLDPMVHPMRSGHFSRGYLRHLFMVDEMLGPMLVTLHNLRHFQRFMADLRATIRTDEWEGFVRRWPVAAEGLRAKDPA
ncbi:MAG: tRNA-guanine transglycosylase, partial [Phycisphaerales bacterium]|nr:tRNA-guanine transglycosylase [Phycisphaerales bacterium]